MVNFPDFYGAHHHTCRIDGRVTPWHAQAIDMGIFVVIEGADGSGKDIHAKELSNRIPSALRARCPAIKETGELLNQFEWEPKLAALAFLTDRAYLTQQVIKPFLAEGGLVICNRYWLSGWVHSVARGMDPEEARRVSLFDQSFCVRPDLTVICDTSDDNIASRIRRRPNATAMDRGDFQPQARSLYRNVATTWPEENVFYLDTTGPKEVAQEILYRRVKQLQEING